VNIAQGSLPNVVQGNFIGTQINGTSPLGNTLHGVFLQSTRNTPVGGTLSGAGNTIAFNGSAGVAVVSLDTGNGVLSNSIHDNGGLGIDLDNNGVTPNDHCDGDGGTNLQQNFPVLTSAVSAGGSTTIQGTLDSTANTTFRIEFFANTACDPSGNGEGQMFLGFTTVTTDANCNASFNVTLPATIPAGQFITATATDPNGNTSEFSQCLTVTGPANQSPMARCQNVTVLADSNCTANASIDNGSFDPDGDPITLNQSPPGPYPLGTTMVTLTVTDNQGASSTCTGMVTVVDTTMPTLTCPADITTSENPPGSGGAVVSYSAPTVSDNCPGVGTPTCNPPSGSTFPLGATMVTCTVSDASNNTASCTFTVTVTQPSACTITCPANIVGSNDPGQCGANVTYPVPTTTGTCGTVTCSPASSSFFPVGTTTVTCTTSAGPSCTFTVTINDTEPPQITCPPNQTTAAGANCQATVSVGTATATDNCPGVTATGTRSDGQPLTDPYPLGVTTITWTAADAAGNMATCMQMVMVMNTPPIAHAGPDQIVDKGATVTLNGSGSSDPDPGQTLTFQWTQTSGPPVTLSGANTATATFTAPDVAEAGCETLTFELKVTDSCGAMATDTVMVNATSALHLRDNSGGNDLCLNLCARTYKFTTESGSMFTGPLVIAQRETTLVFESGPGDPNALRGTVNLARRRGNARLQVPRGRGGRVFRLSDRNIDDNGPCP
jgi:hypothetical protein